ncbi:MAG: transcription antitermination factor NusB [Phascolarctobacterium sp.]|nr:transcription antitermination factor NusB [Phascolarctobacterium sp.]
MTEKMIRRIAREVALQSLFQIDFNEVEAEAAVEASLTEHDEENAPKAYDYALLLVKGVLANKEVIDARLQEFAIDWTVERMSATDRNILRVAVYEMLFADEPIAHGVAINEAVEVAKEYGTDESPRFINGVLGKLAKA